MSGTSVDAIDIVAVKIFDGSFNFIDAKSFQFESTLRKEILELSRNSSELNEAEFSLISGSPAKVIKKIDSKFYRNFCDDYFNNNYKNSY